MNPNPPEAAWIVAAQWSNSGPTFHGPWVYADEAQAWAKDTLDDDAACTFWNVGILTPATVSA